MPKCNHKWTFFEKYRCCDICGLLTLKNDGFFSRQEMAKKFGDTSRLEYVWDNLADKWLLTSEQKSRIMPVWDTLTFSYMLTIYSGSFTLWGKNHGWYVRQYLLKDMLAHEFEKAVETTQVHIHSL